MSDATWRKIEIVGGHVIAGGLILAGIVFATIKDNGGIL